MYDTINVTSNADDFKRNFKRTYQMIKPEICNFTTPVCLLQYAWLVEPDTKYDQAGLWQVECLIEPEKAGELEEQLNALLERWKTQLKAANPDKKYKLAPARFGYEEVDGKPYFRVKTKMKGGGVRADGTQWKKRPPVLYNADGSLMSEEQREAVNKLGPGTTGQVNLRCSGWEAPAFGVGIKIEPEAVIIHKQVEYTKTAQGYGFETKEPEVKEETSKVQGFETVAAGDEF
tara:strand:- start:235 stop:930 length:696 start_codon:yes stop_codon:yes gene_type:complete